MVQTIPARNPFRVAFFIMMAVKGVTYGVFGVRTVPGYPPVDAWERGAGLILLASCIVVLYGLYRREGWGRTMILRWGYLAFAIAQAIFTLGSLFYGLDGLVAAFVNALFAYAGWHDARAEDKLVKKGLK